MFDTSKACSSPAFSGIRQDVLAKIASMNRSKEFLFGQQPVRYLLFAF
jgi:hypothetical protein